MEIESRRTLPDVLPRGYLRGFAFAPDGISFCYVHEPADGKEPYRLAAYRHVLGTEFREDREIFFAGEGEKLRLCLISGTTTIGFLVYRFLEKTRTDFYLKPWEGGAAPVHIIRDAEDTFGPLLVHERILAITDRNAPNMRIVELRLRSDGEPEWVDLVPETDSRIQQWAIAGDHILVAYIRETAQQVLLYDLKGNRTGELPIRRGETVRFVGASPENDELFLESECFTEPIAIQRYSPREEKRIPWEKRTIPFDSASYEHTEVRYASKDGTEIPMFLVGRREVISGGCHPTIMTSYGGYGVSMTPQFSIFVAFLIERGCLFALPNIRGGSEFGAEWHNAAKRRNRQTAYDDFLCAAEWLIKTGRTAPGKLGIFGGSNSGLLVGAALTQRPDLFGAVVCMVPMLDMLRYHLFDNAQVWRDEFGTAEDPEDFAALLRYSPYHQVRDGIAYPATMIVSGDADRNCNPLHARKMAARLQAANSSGLPIFLDYSLFRGHSPVLPLSERVEALTDRMTFLCEHLQLPL
jgi:prolyl oligopeptidase